MAKASFFIVDIFLSVPGMIAAHAVGLTTAWAAISGYANSSEAQPDHAETARVLRGFQADRPHCIERDWR
jgi:hypothetical protein